MGSDISQFLFAREQKPALQFRNFRSNRGCCKISVPKTWVEFSWKLLSPLYSQLERFGLINATWNDYTFDLLLEFFATKVFESSLAFMSLRKARNQPNQSSSLLQEKKEKKLAHSIIHVNIRRNARVVIETFNFYKLRKFYHRFSCYRGIISISEKKNENA